MLSETLALQVLGAQRALAEAGGEGEAGEGGADAQELAALLALGHQVLLGVYWWESTAFVIPRTAYAYAYAYGV